MSDPLDALRYWTCTTGLQIGKSYTQSLLETKEMARQMAESYHEKARESIRKKEDVASVSFAECFNKKVQEHYEWQARLYGDFLQEKDMDIYHGGVKQQQGQQMNTQDEIKKLEEQLKAAKGRLAEEQKPKPIKDVALDITSFDTGYELIERRGVDGEGVVLLSNRNKYRHAYSTKAQLIKAVTKMIEGMA